MTLEELRTEYVAQNPLIKSRRTESLLAIVTGHFAEFLQREPLVTDLADATLNRYARHRRQLGRKESTVENELVRLRCLWNYAAKLGLIPPPQWKLKRMRPNKPTALARREVRAIFRAIWNAEGSMGGVPRSVYFAALIGVIWDSEERISAVRAVTRDDIEKGARYITFRERKGNGRPLRWPLRWTTRKAVCRLLAATDCVRPFAVLSLPSLYDHYDAVLMAAGIEPKPANRPHGLRRSGLSHYQAAGGRAADVADHADERTTRTYYLDPAILGAKPPSSLLFNPLPWWSRVRTWFG